MNYSVIALVIDYKRDQPNHQFFQLNDTQLQAIIAGLCIAYNQVLIFQSNTQLAVCVYGNHVELLPQTFRHFQKHFTGMKLGVNQKAIQMLEFSVFGKAWSKKNLPELYLRLIKAINLSKQANCLGSELEMISDELIKKFKREPVIAGSDNSWIKQDSQTTTSQIKVDTDNYLLYRFALN